VADLLGDEHHLHQPLKDFPVPHLQLDAATQVTHARARRNNATKTGKDLPSREWSQRTCSPKTNDEELLCLFHATDDAIEAVRRFEQPLSI